MWLSGGVRSGTPGVPFRRGGSQTRPRPVPVGREEVNRPNGPREAGLGHDSARLSVGAAFGRLGVWGHSPHGGHRGRIFYPGQAAGPESPATLLRGIGGSAPYTSQKGGGWV